MRATLRWLLGIAFGIPVHSAFALDAAPSLNSSQIMQLRSLTTNRSARYALVTRPSDSARYGVDLVELDPRTQKPLSRLPTPLSCNRLHANTHGGIFCYSRLPPRKAARASDPTGYLFSRDFELLKSYASHKGIISRARFSADGKYTASTVFVTGHSYASGPGQFSTATYVGSASDNKPDEDIQKWQIVRDGKRFDPPDLNLWGVSFDPQRSDRFFVTAHSNGTAYLAQGSIARRKIELIAAGFECPSFSPDGKRIAFKKKVSPLRWAPAIMDLESRKERVFESVPNSVDDQIEWLNNDTLIYEVTTAPLIGKPRTNLMTLDIAKPIARQELWMNDARSPTFVGAR